MASNNKKQTVENLTSIISSSSNLALIGFMNTTHQNLEVLRKEGFEKAEKRVDRETGQGKIFTYSHHTGKIVAVVELLCETDFVAKNELFETLGKDIAMQAASMGEENIKEQEFIKDPSKRISDLVKGVIAKTGENVRIGRVIRVELGK